VRIEESIELAAPREEVWAEVRDPARYGRFLSGLGTWEPQGDGQPGLGARYRMRLTVGPTQAGGLVELVEYDEPSELAWTSILGIDQRGRWRLRDAPGGGTKVTVRLAYQVPGRLFGALADALSAPRVRASLRTALASLKRRVEGGPGEAESKGAIAGVGAVAAGVAEGARVVARARLIRPERPDRLLRAGAAVLRYGATPAAGFAASAARFPNRPAILDEAGMLTFAEVHRRTNALAHALSDAGVVEGDRVAIMCRNHRGFVEAVGALSKLGVHSLLLNTSFAGPQLADVVAREKPRALVYDEEFAELLAEAGRRRKRFVAWEEEPGSASDPTLEELVAAGDPQDVVGPSQEGRVVILTSGTTGTPKGAARAQPSGALGTMTALLSRIPLRARETTMIAAPLFHAWGFAHLALGLGLGSTYVLRRRFDPEQTLAATARHRASTLVAVPVMIQRIMELPPEVRRRWDLSALRVVALSGSALPGDLATRFMDEFGEVIYSLYGSTEVGWAAVAGPEDLRAAPGTAGTPPRGTDLRILDEEGGELPEGQTGRIFVHNDMLFEGYTGGGGKDMVDGFMSTGDVGRIDEEGRLFVEGRDDEMIVSGGENVFPREVEDLLADHPKVAEAAVVGVEDERFGQALKAFVVPRQGASPSAEELRGYVKENLARFKVPREVEMLDELPRTSTGKVLKRELQ
jgi:fatty-acyl-CoA synthase